MPRVLEKPKALPFSGFQQGIFMARQSRSVSRLQDQLKNARARARRVTSSDPVQQLGMGAVGGAILALMNNNNLKLPVPGVPASLQVGLTALIVQKALKPKGMLGKALQSSIAASGAVFGYGLANKFGPGGNRELALMGDEFEQLSGDDSFNYLSGQHETADHITEG
jgi:hypothetical protein